MAHPEINWLIERTTGIHEAQPCILKAAGVVLVVRCGLALARWLLLSPLTLPGLPRWPRLYRGGNCQLVHISRVLTGWGYFFVDRFSRFAFRASKFLLLALLLSFIPHPMIQGWFPPGIPTGMGVCILGIGVVDRTYIHHLLGCWFLGTAADVLITPRWLVTLRFLLGCLPIIQVCRREAHLGLSVMLEPHELAAGEAKESNPRPVFADTWHVTLRVGTRPIRVLPVHSRHHAERIANAFTAVNELLDQNRGIEKRRMTHSAFAFGRSQPRAE